jgi:hypothetical protein
MLQLWKINGTAVRLSVRGKSIPLQAWTGPEGSRGLRLSDFNILSI